MADTSLIGRSLPRIDGLEKVTGAAGFMTDIKLAGMLEAKVLRSPVPHARLLHIDTQRAYGVPGVRAIITAADTPGIRSGPIIADEVILATDKVRYIGDEVAAVAAESEEAAQSALELIKVQYEELPAVFDPEQALLPSSPSIHDNGNLAYRFHYERGNVEEGFSRSNYIFSGRYETQMQHQGYLEPRACIAAADASSKITIWGGYQNIFHIRRRLAALLNMSEGNIRIIQPYTGGGYGGKTSTSKAPIAALLALKTGRPVRIVNSREEDFRAGRPRAPGIIEHKIGVKKDGTLVARQVKAIVDCGAYAGNAPGISQCMAMRSENLYRFSHLKGEGLAVYTNKTPTGSCRGFGNAEGHFAMEGLLDEIAEALGLDPLDLRLRNMVGPDTVTSHGWKITSCGLGQCLSEVTHRAGWRKRRTKKTKGRGLGLACGICVAGYRNIFDYDGSSAFVKLEVDGRVTLITGEGDTGAGGWSALVQMAAEELGARPEDVRIVAADTAVTPYCLGAYAARTTFIGGNAVRAAAADAKNQLFKIAAPLLEAAIEDLEARDSQVFVKGAPGCAISFAEVANKTIYRSGGGPILGCGAYDPPTEMPDKETLYGNFSPSYPFCSHVAEVEVDEATGRVEVLSFYAADDIGRAINPLAVEGQIQGCLTMGLGLALKEEMAWDGGSLANASLMDYKVPSASDLPMLVPTLVESIDPLGPFGAKSASEVSISAVPAAIANAIYDAVGVRIRSLPITPEKILAALKTKEEGISLSQKKK